MSEERRTESAGSCSEAHREIAEKARRMIMDNLEKHLKIEELAHELHVSQTQIKVCFRNYYGMPIYSYSRRKRMEEAARLLEETDETILEIAGKAGYENGSKFAKAFRDEMGTAPGEYRRRVLWEKTDQEAGF